MNVGYGLYLLHFPQLSLKQHIVKSSPQVLACKSDSYFTYLPQEGAEGLIILQGIVEGCFYWCVNTETNKCLHLHYTCLSINAKESNQGNVMYVIIVFTIITYH